MTFGVTLLPKAVSLQHLKEKEEEAGSVTPSGYRGVAPGALWAVPSPSHITLPVILQHGDALAAPLPYSMAAPSLTRRYSFRVPERRYFSLDAGASAPSSGSGGSRYGGELLRAAGACRRPSAAIRRPASSEGGSEGSAGGGGCGCGCGYGEGLGAAFGRAEKQGRLSGLAAGVLL